MPLESDTFAGKTVAIAGAGPSLAAETDTCRRADVVVAASTAAEGLLEEGVTPDWVVTDLDKHPAVVREYTESHIPVAVHAHGDNRPLLREHVPTYNLESVLPTTQARPVGPVVNPGGFTDGDRAAFLADHLGADTLRFAGWDFEAATGEKRRKLRWAERLLAWLERFRGERFDVLDGRRGSVDLSGLPAPDPTEH